MDVVCMFNGYHTCVYRCFCCGKPNKKQKDIHARCLEYQLAGIEATKPGVTTADIATVWPDAKAMGAKSEHEIFGLQYGHGLGVGLWEFPIISRAYSIEHPVEIKPGMVFALETQHGKNLEFGVRIEEMLIVHEDKTEIISSFPVEEITFVDM